MENFAGAFTLDEFKKVVVTGFYLFVVGFFISYFLNTLKDFVRSVLGR